MSKSYDVTREHRQQGVLSPIEERVNMYKQMMDEEGYRNDEYGEAEETHQK